MRHLIYLMFRCDVDVMESLELEGSFLELNTDCDRKTKVSHERNEPVEEDAWQQWQQHV